MTLDLLLLPLTPKITDPNDIFVGETIQFSMVKDVEPG